MASIDLKGTVFRIYDGTPTTPNYIEVKIGEGSFNWNEKREIHFVKSRGDMNEVRIGDDIEMDVSFQFVWDFITASDDAEIPTVEDALKHRGAAADWVSASVNDPDAPYSVNISIVYTPLCGDEEPEQFVFPEYHYTSLAHSIKDGTVDSQGQCNYTEAIVERIS